MMKNFLILLSLILFSCSGKQEKNMTETKNEMPLFHFTEIGRKELLTTKFPKEWKENPYGKSHLTSLTDSTNESNLNNLNYFDNVKGKLVKRKRYFSNFSEKGIRVDSIFIIDSISNKKQSFVYLKIFKTIEDPDYDFPPTIKQIDILIFENSKFLRKLNIYTEKNYPFAIDLKLGYFDKSGNLFMKEFKTDEENTNFTKEEQFKLSNEGKIIHQK